MAEIAMADRRKVKREGSERRRPKTWSPAAMVRDNGREVIARRAYEIFEWRGRAHGHDLEDWFQAERLLRDTGKESSIF
jgi:hypothetical protein